MSSPAASACMYLSTSYGKWPAERIMEDMCIISTIVPKADSENIYCLPVDYSVCLALRSIVLWKCFCYTDWYKIEQQHRKEQLL